MDDALLDYTEVIWASYNFLFDSEVILQQGQNQIDELSFRGVLLVLSSTAFSPSPISIQFEAGALSACCQSRRNIVLPPKSDLSKMKTTFECLVYRESF